MPINFLDCSTTTENFLAATAQARRASVDVGFVRYKKGSHQLGPAVLCLAPPWTDKHLRVECVEAYHLLNRIDYVESKGKHTFCWSSANASMRS
jgi:hypothetical protein